MEKPTLNIYLLSGPALSTEWPGIMGDKFRTHGEFTPVLVTSPEKAQVVVWDGVLTPKFAGVFTDFLASLRKGAVFLVTGEAGTLLENHPFVKLSGVERPCVFLPPSQTLPEEILEALSECRRKIPHG